MHRNFALAVLGFWILTVGIFFREVSLYSLAHNISLFQALEIIDFTIQQRLTDYGMLSFVLFVVIYTIRPIVFFPASVMTVTTVLIFGAVEGFFISYVGELSSAALTYYIGRYFGEELGITRRSFMRKITPYFRENAFLSVFVLRIIPIFPFDFVNYASGILKINFKKYFYATVLGVAPGLIVFIFLSYSLIHRELLPWSIASTIALITIGIILKKEYEVHVHNEKII